MRVYEGKDYAWRVARRTPRSLLVWIRRIRRNIYPARQHPRRPLYSRPSLRSGGRGVSWSRAPRRLGFHSPLRKGPFVPALPSRALRAMVNLRFYGNGLAELATLPYSISEGRPLFNITPRVLLGSTRRRPADPPLVRGSWLRRYISALSRHELRGSAGPARGAWLRHCLRATDGRCGYCAWWSGNCLRELGPRPHAPATAQHPRPRRPRSPNRALRPLR